MSASSTIPGFAGEVIQPGDPTFDTHREVWNAMVDRRPAVIARSTSAADVAAAVRHAREAGLEIAVKCGGHSMVGLSVPDGGLMIDLSPMSDVRIDTDQRLAILRVFHLMGDVRLRVSAGTRVTTSGTTLLGDQRVDVEAGEGPEFELRAWGLFGDVRIND